MNPRYAYRVGQAMTHPALPPNGMTEHEAEEARSFGYAFKQITPTLFLVGIATGMAFAIGNIVVHKIFQRAK